MKKAVAVLIVAILLIPATSFAMDVFHFVELSLQRLLMYDADILLSTYGAANQPKDLDPYAYIVESTVGCLYLDADLQIQKAYFTCYITQPDEYIQEDFEKISAGISALETPEQSVWDRKESKIAALEDAMDIVQICFNKAIASENALLAGETVTAFISDAWIYTLEFFFDELLEEPTALWIIATPY